MEKVVKAIQKLGLPVTDAYDLPTSTKRFPDGAWYRLEISGIERPNVLEALVDEVNKRKVPVHRLICTVMGSCLMDDHEIKAIAQMAADVKMEAIVTAGLASAWDTGRTRITPEGAFSGLRCRGHEHFRYMIAEIFRCIDLGIRGFLCTDEGLLWTLTQMKKNGDIPEDVIFKVSVFAGHGTAASGKLLESLGAGTFNPAADLSLPQLAAIRKYINIPMDVYAYVMDGMGGFNRFYDAPEIARVAAPVYFKLEPGPTEAEVYKPWYSPDALAFQAREKVKFAQIICEKIDQAFPTATVSKMGPADLAVPKP